MINSAKINGVISEISAIEVNFHLFKQRYKYFPGDYPNTTFGKVCGSNGYGDGNGYVNTINELLIAFLEMNAGLGTKYPTCSSTCSNYASSSTCGSTIYYYKGGVNAPKSTKWDKMIFAFTELGVSGNYVASIQLGGDNLTSAFSRPGYLLSGIDAFTFDTKIDDGVYTTGRFFSHLSYQSLGVANCITSSNYNKTSGVDGCFAPAWSVESTGPNPPAR